MTCPTLSVVGGAHGCSALTLRMCPPLCLSASPSSLLSSPIPLLLPSLQAFAELYVAQSLREFGVYSHPPDWDVDFTRPPIDARHPLWKRYHPAASVASTRVDGKMANRERFSSSAIENGELPSSPHEPACPACLHLLT
jgi:hypothetical protein